MMMAEINSLDAVLLSRILLEMSPSGVDMKRADLNGDGVVDTMDYVLLGRYIFGVITEFPVSKTNTGMGAVDIIKPCWNFYVFPTWLFK